MGKERVLKIGSPLAVKINVKTPAYKQDISVLTPGTAGKLTEIDRDEFGERLFTVAYTGSDGSEQTVKLYGSEFVVS